MQGMFDGMAEGLVMMAIGIAAVCFSLGALAVWLLPKFWAWLAPIIHAATA